MVKTNTGTMTDAIGADSTAVADPIESMTIDNKTFVRPNNSRFHSSYLIAYPRYKMLVRTKSHRVTLGRWATNRIGNVACP